MFLFAKNWLPIWFLGNSPYYSTKNIVLDLIALLIKPMNKPVETTIHLAATRHLADYMTKADY